MQGETAAAVALEMQAGPRVGGIRAAIGARVFYGWVNVVAAACMVSVGVGVVQAFAVFVAPLEQAFGWSRSAISGAYSLAFAIFGASSVLMGALADRYGTRRVAMAGGSLFALGLVLCAWANTLWGLYLAFAVIGGIGVGSLHSPLAYLAAKWFDRRKGLAMGIVLSGTGIGVMLASPFARALMAWGNWRTAFLGLGVVALVVVLGMGSLLCDAPEHMGQSVDGAARPAAGAGEQESGWSMATARRTRSFWVLLGTFFFCCACHSGPSLHLAAHAGGWGLSGAAAAGVLSTFGGFSIAGRIGLGFVADRIGGKRSLLISLPLQACAALALAFTQSPWAFYAAAAFLGIAFGGVYAQFPALTREYFGATNVGAVYGSQMFLSSLGMAIGGYGVGALFDVTGSYRDPFLASAFSGLLSVALALGLSRPKPPA
jgi:MFS family permease